MRQVREEFDRLNPMKHIVIEQNTSILKKDLLLKRARYDSFAKMIRSQSWHEIKTLLKTDLFSKCMLQILLLHMTIHLWICSQ